MSDKIKSQEQDDVSLDSVAFAHQLNNLLTAILSNISIAKIDSPSTGEFYRLLSEAEGAAVEARDLVKQLQSSEVHETQADFLEEGEVSGHGALTSKRVLLVDDDRRAGMAMSRMLEHLGCRVECVSDGDAAVDLYKNADPRFDLVLLDLLLPGSAGAAETLRQLREFDPKVKAVLVSGHHNAPQMSDYRNLGFQAAIAKPYRLGELTEVLNRTFSNQTP
ncbi:MAG: response regulator [bacterium]